MRDRFTEAQLILKERCIKLMSEKHNIHEHNHIKWTNDALEKRIKLLTDNILNINYTGDRPVRTRRVVRLLVFELSCRYGDIVGKSWEWREL